MISLPQRDPRSGAYGSIGTVVRAGIGWPLPGATTPRPEFSTGLGWPPKRDDPQENEGYPQMSPADDVPVSRETSASPLVESPLVSRETERPRNPLQVPTAADHDAVAATYDDETTPLARAVMHQLLAREGRAMSAPIRRPAETRVMVVANQKGGVGKTTTTVNIAAGLAQLGQRVLVIDLDPQGNASTALAVKHQRGVPSTYDVLVDGVPLADVVHPSPELPGLFVVPATIDLAGAEIELVSVVARESRLSRAIAAHPGIGSVGEDRFDYVFIDCPPSLGLLTLNALVAGAEMLIPIQAEYYALEGLGQLVETVEMVRAHLNQHLTVSTILITMYDARTKLAAGVAEEVRSHFGPKVLRTSIPRSVRVSEAPSYGQSVMTYDPGSPGALSYLEAAREIAAAATSSPSTDTEDPA